MAQKIIVHPTDFSAQSDIAFAHALRIAIATKSELYLVHVAESKYDEYDGFPHVRRALAAWGLMSENDSPDRAVGKLGIKVKKIGLETRFLLRGLTHFLAEHPSHLIVLATHGRDGVASWLQGSVAEDFSRASRLPTLFIPPDVRGFVDQNNGDVRLSKVLVPIDHSPPTASALDTIQNFIAPMNKGGAMIELMHVGTTAPLVRRIGGDAIVPVAVQTGDVISTILQAAEEQEIDLIAMPTAGHHGFLDALRGSTTERVLRHAPCPVLAVPAG